VKRHLGWDVHDAWERRNFDAKTQARVERFLDPANFETDYDGDILDSYPDRQYAKGIAQGEGAHRVTISANDVWHSDNRDGSMTSSYERLGYHRATRQLFLGFLNSDVEILVMCFTGDPNVDGRNVWFRINPCAQDPQQTIEGASA